MKEYNLPDKPHIVVYYKGSHRLLEKIIMDDSGKVGYEFSPDNPLYELVELNNHSINGNGNSNKGYLKFFNLRRKKSKTHENPEIRLNVNGDPLYSVIIKSIEALLFFARNNGFEYVGFNQGPKRFGDEVKFFPKIYDHKKVSNGSPDPDYTPESDEERMKLLINMINILGKKKKNY